MPGTPPSARATAAPLESAAAILASARAGSPAPVTPLTTHPRLWVTSADLPRLRGWAVSTNPLYAQGLEAAAIAAKANMDQGLIPAQDNGGVTWSSYPCEAYAELFAFMALVNPVPAVRDDYAHRARTLLMYVMNIAVQGAAADQPFRDPYFSTYDRSRWWGEGFPLTVDWIYPYLTTTDKATIHTVFLRWAHENLTAGQTSGDPAPPPGVYNDPRLVDTAYKRRWAMNNYFIAHMRQMGLMALALDPADDPNGTLGAYLRDAIQSRLYMIDTALRTDAAGGLSPEGFEYGPESFGRIMEFMWALHTAGQDDPIVWGQQVSLANHPFWAAALPALLHSSSPAARTFDSWIGPVYEAANFGDVQNIEVTDFITSFGPLALYAAEIGNTTALQYFRWVETNMAPGGASYLLQRTANTLSANEQHNSIFYFLLFDPTPGAPAPRDPRPAQPLTYFNPALGRILARTDWSPNATWFTYKLGWAALDHNHGDGNQFEFYRHGEWLTKERTGWGWNVGSSDYHNTLALYQPSLSPAPQPGDFFDVAWGRGSQWNYVNAGDPTLVAHSFGPNYVYALGDATPLYNYPSSNGTNVLHASRSIFWLNGDYIFVYDRAATVSASSFKRFWLNLPAAATINGPRTSMTTPGGQHLYITTLLPANATIAVQPAEDLGSEPALHDPITYRLLVQNPTAASSVRWLHVLQGANATTPADAVSLVHSSSGTPFDGAVFHNTVIFAPVDLTTPFTSVGYSVPTATGVQIITGLAPSHAYSARFTVVGSQWQVNVTPGGGLTTDAGGVLVLYAPGVPTPTATRTPLPRATATATATRPHPTATATATRPAGATATRTATPPHPTATATATTTRPRPTTTATATRPVGATATATATGTSCGGNFSDAPVGSTYYTWIHDLTGRGAISGYGDCTFRPGNTITRGQAAKVIVLALALHLVPPAPAHFSDVPPGSPFFSFVETAYANNLISGYSNGMFRPFADVTRAQLTKMMTVGRHWTIRSPTTPHFRDVPASHPFYTFIETAYQHAVISGYSCGISCLEFRPANNATRGQGAKIIDLALQSMDVTVTP